MFAGICLMTNEQQHIEVWRKEFEALIGDYKWLEISGNYMPIDVQNKWIGFQMAKRNQPVIDVPEGDSDGMVDLGEVHAAITAAGYQYKVK